MQLSMIENDSKISFFIFRSMYSAIEESKLMQNVPRLLEVFGSKRLMLAKKIIGNTVE